MDRSTGNQSANPGKGVKDITKYKHVTGLFLIKNEEVQDKSDGWAEVKEIGI